MKIKVVILVNIGLTVLSPFVYASDDSGSGSNWGIFGMLLLSAIIFGINYNISKSKVRKIAEEGTISAQIEFGELLMKEQTTDNNMILNKKKYDEGMKWLQKAAEKGSAKAQYKYAMALYFCRESITDVYQFLHKSAEQGYYDAQILLGYALCFGKYDMEVNLEESLYWLNKASERTFWPEVYYYMNVATMIQNGEAVDESDVRNRHTVAAEQGDKTSQYLLALALWFGMKNKNEALVWIRKSAEQGQVNAQFFFSILLCEGEKELNLEKNKDEAMKWLRKAAEQGQNAAQEYLADRLREANTQQEKEEAVKWSRKAAENNRTFALYDYAVALDDGLGVGKNKEAAAIWYRKAAEQGVVGAQYKLARMLYKGDGIIKNEEQGLEWYQKAAIQGSDKAQEKINKLKLQEK